MPKLPRSARELPARIKVTPQEIERIKQMRAEGMKWAAIAQATGRTEHAMRRIQERYRLVKCGACTWTPEALKRLVALKIEGVPDKKIAAMMGRTAFAINMRWRIERRNLSPNGPLPKRGLVPKAPDAPFVWSDEHDDKLVELRDRGERWADIAAAIGASANQCKTRFHTISIRSVEPPAHMVKERRCLCGCQRLFLSSSPGERIRPECRDAWSNRV